MKILYITQNAESTDFGLLLSANGAKVEYADVHSLPEADAADFDAFVFDGVYSDGGLLFLPDEREAADRLILSGKPALCTLCPYIMTICCTPPESTRYARPVVTKALSAEGLSERDILDEQCNLRVKCYTSSGSINPLLCYKQNPKGFYAVSKLDDSFQRSDAALWFERDNLLFCTFSLSDFAKARFAPRKKWFCIYRFIAKKLFDIPVDEKTFDGIYKANGYTSEPITNFEASLRESIEKAVRWHINAGVINESGLVTEGLAASIRPNGIQDPNRNVTTDGNGETSMLFSLYSRLCGSREFDGIIASMDEYTAAHIGSYDGILDGYGRSGDGAWWNACYGDGVARGVIFPRLFMQFSEGKSHKLDKALRGLDFLANTTGADGLRFCRTDIIDLKAETLSLFSLDRVNGKWSWGDGGIKKASELKSIEAKTPSAHYNGYYLATLLLAYKVTGNEVYREIGVRGLTSIMESYYPFTAREHSETQELCRLILPLSYLYWVTHEEKHLGWLKKVIASLNEKRLVAGAFAEWDSDYSACCAGTAGTECSVLAENGNPVIDLLYSMNWLPFSLAQAYFITKDEDIKTLFTDVCTFLMSIQIKSSNPLIDGAWARAYDVSASEVYGVPNDVGWAPWSVQTGWTMSQIPMGFILWLLRDEIGMLFD